MDQSITTCKGKLSQGKQVAVCRRLIAYQKQNNKVFNKVGGAPSKLPSLGLSNPSKGRITEAKPCKSNTKHEEKLDDFHQVKAKTI